MLTPQQIIHAARELWTVIALEYAVRMDRIVHSIDAVVFDVEAVELLGPHKAVATIGS
jgi:hypothetical protein